MTTVRDVTSPLSRPTEFVVDSGEFVVVCPQDSRSLPVKLCLDNNDGRTPTAGASGTERSFSSRATRTTDGWMLAVNVTGGTMESGCNELLYGWMDG